VGGEAEKEKCACIGFLGFFLNNSAIRAETASCLSPLVSLLLFLHMCVLYFHIINLSSMFCFQAKKLIEHNRKKERTAEQKEIDAKRERVRRAQEANRKAEEERRKQQPVSFWYTVVYDHHLSSNNRCCSEFALLLRRLLKFKHFPSA
jgi:hypothetical protein